jgi:hypothetical protein
MRRGRISGIVSGPSNTLPSRSSIPGSESALKLPVNEGTAECSAGSPLVLTESSHWMWQVSLQSSVPILVSIENASQPSAFVPAS